MSEVRRRIKTLFYGVAGLQYPPPVGPQPSVGPRSPMDFQRVLKTGFALYFFVPKIYYTDVDFLKNG